MNELIQKVLQWGEDKKITGPDGKGTPYAQVAKVLEEAKETAHAVHIYDLEEIRDGIGDTCVTLILLAEMYGWTLEECLQDAYNVIANRTGRIENGSFIKDK